MLRFVKGTLAMRDESTAVVECSGIGYEIMLSTADLAALPAVGSPVCLYTFLNVNENTGVSLFGFLNPDDLAMFKLLITVSGIGPKGAQAILSVMPADVLRFAILSEDAKSIAKAPGIGAKTAGKMIIELKDKMNLQEAFEKTLTNNKPTAVDNQLQGAKEDAVLALVALGYSRTDATRAVSSAALTDSMTVDEVLRQSLKYL